MFLRAKMELTEYAEGTHVSRCVSTVPPSEASGAHLSAMRPCNILTHLVSLSPGQRAVLATPLLENHSALRVRSLFL